MWACPWETFFFSLRRGLRAAPLAALFCGGIDRELLLAGLDEDRKLGEYRWDRTQRGLSPATYLPEASPGIEGAGGPSQRELEGDGVPLESTLTSCPPSSCRPRCASDPSWSGRWCGFAARAPEGPGGGGCPRNSRSRPCGGCRRPPRGGGHPRP